MQQLYHALWIHARDADLELALRFLVGGVVHETVLYASIHPLFYNVHG